MAVQYNGGVVIGADSRTTTGSYIANRVTDKLTKGMFERALDSFLISSPRKSLLL